MKTLNISRGFYFLLFMTVIVGCMQSTENVSPPAPAVTTMSSSSTFPTKIIFPTSTRMAIDTPTPLAIPTYVSTLSIEDARKRLLDLLADNGGCHLPCLWGITPGGSTPQKAQSILLPLSGISNIFEVEPSFDPSGGFVAPSYVERESDLMLNTELGYLVGNQVVSHINFVAREEEIPTDPNGNWTSRRPIFDSPTFMKRVEFYSLSHTLSEQGIPDSVMIHSSGLTGSPVVAGGFDIALLYPEQGIWVNYTMPMFVQGNVKKGCPANSHIEMDLYPSGNPDIFLSLLDKTDWAVKKNWYRPLEEATSMSIEEFYQTFRTPTDKCIETLAKLWPTPES